MTATTALTRRPTTPAAPGSRPLTAAATWRDRGACFNRPAQWWDDDAKPTEQRKAREACLSCPVFAQCLTDAVASEGGYDFGRAHMKAGLSGRDRDWLYRHSRKHGSYDAEEARLLALEARVSGRKVKEIATREGVEGATVPLAARLLAGLVEDESAAGPDPQAKIGAYEKAFQRIDDILVWRDEGVSLAEIGQRIGVSRGSVTHALKKYLESDSAPTRKPVGIAAEEIEAIADRRRRGMTWGEMDAEADLAPGTTAQRVSRWRRQAEKRGEPIPRELAREIQALSEEQVVKLRERAAAGATDREQAMELGISRQQVTRIARGESYRRYGGPIRPKKVGAQPCEASRVLFNGAQAGFVKAS
jgi:transcriptional regulator with XRE-family HTH domain